MTAPLRAGTPPHRCTRAHGFTLIEMLVALVIFAAMAAMAWGGLNSIAGTRADLARKEDDFQRLARIVSMLNRDLRQAVPRPVRNNFGSQIAAFVGGPNGLELTRLGFANPLSEQRSHLERISYSLDGGGLVRANFPVLDRAPTTSAATSVLRDRIDGFSLRYLDAQQQWVETWPEQVDGDAPAALTSLPRAVEVQIRTPDYGVVTQTIELVTPWTDPIQASQ